MARTTVKATYSLAPDIVARLERLATQWKVSKSEALTRAIREASEPSPEVYPIELLDALQGGARVSAADAAAWAVAVRTERQQVGERSLRPAPPAP